MHSNPSLKKLSEDYPEALRRSSPSAAQVDYSSAAGYLGIELFSLMVPLLLLVAAIGTGAGTIAGEEERGTLELLLANPVSRTPARAREVARARRRDRGPRPRALARALGRRAPGRAWTSRRGTSPPPRSAPGCSRSRYGAIALLLGAATGKRAIAIGLTAAAAVAAYLVNGLAPLVDALEALQKVSPFYHYAAGDPLREGISCHAHGSACRNRGVANGAGALASPAATSLLERRADLEEVLVELDLDVLHVGLIGERELVPEAGASTSIV